MSGNYKDNTTRSYCEKCSCCGVEKNESEFHRDRTRKDGFYSICKLCKNKKRVDGYNPEYSRSYSKKHREENKEYYLEYSKRYREENKEYYKKKKREYEKKQRYTIDGKIKRNMSQQLYRMMKGQKAGKRWVDVLGYETEELKNHLKKTIPFGYCIDDYLSGKLHIDHIIPKCLYNHEIEEELKKCWDFRNLRLISAIENEVKNRFLNYSLVENYNIYDLLPASYVDKRIESF